MPEETREASHKTESALREKSNPSASSLTWVPVQEREEAIVLLEVFEAVILSLRLHRVEVSGKPGKAASFWGKRMFLVLNSNLVLPVPRR